ncbi:hypothetical protein [Microbulbifer spongiae]|uniref:DUF2986 domain-containing protein n=1 Tax=Microbulbifer spongiae TaxID=2944933 RepID=A0ABY9E684_9GAMM|nr:hypothetical protein [Microbulbifer sp. MI-G]WKD48518.1 hypothetical protein M8T91_11340 [Microbulbifer sp. MI-G]
MNDKIKDFNTAHDERLKGLSKEERAKAGLKKLAQQMRKEKGKIKEPKGLASGKSDKDRKMIIDLDKDHDNE